MAKAVFTTATDSIRDDLPEYRYHFPRTYLRQVEAATGDCYAYVSDHRELDRSVSFRACTHYYEFKLHQAAASTGKGVFGRAVLPARP